MSHGDDSTRVRGRVIRLVDRLIPAELHADIEAQLRSRVLVAGSAAIGGLTALALAIRVATFPFDLGVLVAAAMIVLLFALPLVQRSLRSHRAAGGLLVGALFLALTALSLIRGAFPDASIPLYATVPVIGVFFVGPRFGYLVAAGLVALLLGLQAVLIAPTQAAVTEFWWTYVALAAVSPCMCAALATAFERARVRSQAQLAAVNAALADAQARAEAANRGKTEFLRHVSHELRTPLNAILGYAELVGEDLRQTSDPAAEDVAKIRAASVQLLGLLNDLLDIARVEAGALVLELGDVDVHVLLAELRDTAAPLAAAHRNTLDVAAREPLPPLRTDGQRLRQVLLNLLGNACKFTESGRVELSAAAQDGRMIFSVRDTGIGMDAAQLARLFEPFVQVDPSAERRRQGSGLGLALSRQLVAHLGGEIAVTSEPGRGSAFTVSLPLTRAA